MTEAAVGELERLAMFRQVSDGLIPEWARRPLMPWELRAGISYAAIARILADTYRRNDDLLHALQTDLANDLAAHIGEATDRVQVDQRITAWAVSRPQTTRALVTDATNEVTRTLRRCAVQAREQVIREAAFQGVHLRSVQHMAMESPDLPGYNPLRDFLRSLAAAATGLVQTKVEQVALLVSQRPDSPDPAVKAANDTSIDAAVDTARQGAHVAQGEGRLDAVKDLPEPEEIYASELLDGRTCVPCEKIDGTVFYSVAQAELSYPGSGPYRYCDGGPRCRGTLVFVWAES